MQTNPRAILRLTLLLAVASALLPALPRGPVALAQVAEPDLMMTGPLGISTDRQGSGTTWLPEAVLMPFRHQLVGRWDVMAHWNAFVHYNAQRPPRGEREVGSINWTMVMASRPLLGGRLQLRAMNSVDALTVGRCGYSYLAQSGETCYGSPNADRQHPHDFFMELGALYERALGPSVAWSLYAAPAGEPASGPPAFMHRPSAVNDPFSNITHHWQDATHISFGVATAAIYGRRWKLEGSAFNAREPDEHRWNFDLRDASLRSAAGRVTIQPSERLSWSGSYAYLHRPEPSEPLESMHRFTTSLLVAGTARDGKRLAAALVLGANRHDAQWEPSILAEANLDAGDRNAFFTRVEHVEKSAESLDLPPSAAGHPVTSLTLGYVRELGSWGVHTAGLGIRATATLLPEALRAAYGSTAPTGLVLFLRFRPKAMTQAELDAMHERMRHAGMKMD